MGRTVNIAILGGCAFVFLAGCAQPQPRSTEAAGETLAVMQKLSDAASPERWKLVQLPGTTDQVAFVVDPAMQASMLVGCKEQDILFISLALERRLTGDPKQRAVVLWLDAGGFAAPNWTPRADTEDDAPTVFDIFHDRNYDYDFWPLIGNLKKHDRILAVIKENGRETSRHAFTLTDAVETIDAVLKRCGDAKPPQGPLPS